MVVDLDKCLLKKERKYFSVIDGILEGEGQGPFCPTSKHANVLIGGRNFLATDIVAVRYMGIDPLQIRYLDYFIRKWGLDLEHFSVFMGGIVEKDYFVQSTRYADFEVPEPWQAIKWNPAQPVS